LIEFCAKVSGRATPTSNPPRQTFDDYLLGVAAGAVSVDFLFFFTFECFLVVVALVLSFDAGALVDGAGVCANEIPATARVSARPLRADVSFFMMF
jgi:hypothetical protein